jgi:hypothetical protein
MVVMSIRTYGRREEAMGRSFSGKWLRGGLRLLAFAGMAFGLLMIGISGYHVWRSYGARHWSRTSGTIIDSRIWIDRVPYPGGKGRTRFASSTQTSVVYCYYVGGRKYQSNVVSFDDHQRTQMPDRYPEGRSVAVFYNPADPADAVLEPSIIAYTKALLVLGSAAVLGSGICIVLSWNPKSASGRSVQRLRRRVV